MLSLPHLKIFAVFSSFPLIIGENLSAVGIDDKNALDGAQFIKGIINGGKISQRPGLLLFTAPYKLCDGGCNGTPSHFGMVFPLYVGKKGVKAYKSIYHRDFKKIHSERPNAPFARRTTRAPFTLCPTGTCPTLEVTTTETTTPSTTVTAETTTPLICPPISMGMCPRHNKTANNSSSRTGFTARNSEENDLT